MHAFFLVHIPLPKKPSESGVTASDQPLLMVTMEQLELSALLKGTLADFSPSRLRELTQ
jgi:hypothetical protein